MRRQPIRLRVDKHRSVVRKSAAGHGRLLDLDREGITSSVESRRFTPHALPSLVKPSLDILSGDRRAGRQIAAVISNSGPPATAGRFCFARRNGTSAIITSAAACNSHRSPALDARPSIGCQPNARFRVECLGERRSRFHAIVPVAKTGQAAPSPCCAGKMMNRKLATEGKLTEWI